MADELGLRRKQKELAEIPAMPNSEGVDEWWWAVFDSNGDHSEPLGEGRGTFAECVLATWDCMAKPGPTVHYRTVIERMED